MLSGSCHRTCLPFVITCAAVSLNPAPQKGEGEGGAPAHVGLWLVCRLTCEIQVIRGPVRSLSRGLVAFGEGGAAASPCLPLRVLGCCSREDAVLLSRHPLPPGGRYRVLLGTLAEQLLSLWLWFERQGTSLAHLLKGAGPGVKS